MRNRDYVAAHGELIINWVAQGHVPYLLTFMFRQLSGSRQAVREQMMAEVERVYRTSLTRVVRNIHANSPRHRFPIWVACPDYPVGKSSKSSLRDVTVNGGQHVHAIVLLPPTNRLCVRFDLHLKELSHVYVRDPLIRLDAQPITHRQDYVVGYNLKGVKRGRVAQEDVLYLPRSSREMPSREVRLLDWALSRGA